MTADRCRRTAGVVDRAAAGRATEADRDHVAGCAVCTRALDRMPAFERDLGGALASLAAEPLPPRLLEVAPLTGSAVAVPRGAWSVARWVVLGAVGVLVAAIGAAVLRPPDTGPAEPAPLIRSEPAMVAAMADLGFSCRATVLGPAASPPVKGSLCTPAVARQGVSLAAALERDPAGSMHSVYAKGKAEPVAGAAGKARVEDTLARIARVAFPSTTDADAAEAWVRSVMPNGRSVTEATKIGGLDLRFEWSTQLGYQLHVDVPPGMGPGVPSGPT